MRRAVAVRKAVAPAPTGSRTIGRAARAGGGAGAEHRIDPRGAERANVEDQRAGKCSQFGDLLGCVRHDGRSADRQQGVGSRVHDDEVGDVVNQRGLGANALKVVRRCVRRGDGVAPFASGSRAGAGAVKKAGGSGDRLSVAMHGGGGEGRQANGDVLGASVERSRVADPFPGRVWTAWPAVMSSVPPSCSTRSSPRSTMVNSSNSGRWPGSVQPPGERMCATERRASPVETRPMIFVDELRLGPGGGDPRRSFDPLRHGG